MKFLIKYFFISASVISVALMSFISMFMTLPSRDVRFTSVLAAASVLFLGLYIFPFKKTKVDIVEKRVVGVLFSLFAVATLGPRYQGLSHIILIAFSSIAIVLFLWECIPRQVKENQWVVYRKKVLVSGQKYVPALDRNFVIINSRMRINFSREFESLNDYYLKVNFKADIEVTGPTEATNGQTANYDMVDHIEIAAKKMLISELERNGMNSWFSFIINGESAQGFSFEAGIVHANGGNIS